VACGAAVGMENRLACLRVRPGDTSDYNHRGHLDSRVRTVGWDSGSPATNPLRDSDFNRYGSVLVCNDPAVMPPKCQDRPFPVLPAAEIQRLSEGTLPPIVVLELYTPKSL
jgi:hypothetical protein